MGARVESEPTWSTADIFARVNILQKSPFILEAAGIPESCTVLHPRNIAAEDAGPASRQATYKNILPGRLIVALRTQRFVHRFLFNSPSQRDWRLARARCP